MAELARLPAVGNSTAPEDAMLEAGLTPFLPGALDEADEAVRAEKARMLAEKKAQRKATNKRALVDPIISSKRLEVYGRWMSRKTARFRILKGGTLESRTTLRVVFSSTRPVKGQERHAAGGS